MTTDNETYLYWRDVNGEKTHLCELQEGDTFVMDVNWHDDRINNVFTVTNPVSRMAKETYEKGHLPMADVKAEGRDGNTYKIYVDNVHVECFTDDKQGRDRGGKSSRPKLLD
jgi:hypothetical protein